jgi:hypothetical protein
MKDRTCATCKHQKGIFKHPWNKEEWAKGACNDLIGYGCAIEDVVENNGAIVFMDKDTGTCEVFEEDLNEKKSRP